VNVTKRQLAVVTNSEMTCFRRCQREHHYSYELGYRAVEDAEALRFGALWHAALEVWWLGQGLDAALDVATRGAIDEFEAAKVRVLLRGYDARWGHELHEVVAVEREFYAPLLNPETGAPSRTYELGGKLDVLLQSKFVEHKTTSEDIGLGSVYWRRLTLDPQVSTYYAGAKSLGHDVHGCVYDVVRKPALRPAQVPLVDEAGFKIVLDAQGERVYCKTPNKGGPKPRETASTADGYVLQTRPETAEEFEARLTEDVAAQPDRYYQRGEVVRLEADEREAALDAWQLTQAMREGQRLGRHPRNPDACQRYGRVCSYFDVCTGVATLDDTSRFQRVENVHQELKGKAA
jgi:hypothetical protein